ncbi:MAG: AbrB/MazE/SpoVT family DNA-binding domain-containing protein [Burkholderiaceae bacterium]|jgi:antitoxin VapB|nr:AbrB/MazE/SpoVT family DNA-binding domain-containing protein [Burkholderiaceae bacterium]PKO45624.1 MAG: AbrB family transcriptional regulator [Betaproteobacteria bacterium HGW-Betaproteobacteria-3]
MSTTAKLFMSGRSQAIRLPAKFRLNANEVRIESVGGGALWVQPENPPGQSLVEWLDALYQTTDPLPETFLADRNDPPAQHRDWS